ncbi:MAG: nucleoside hydrolase [Eubacteriales bacterium]|nr:nucleoside hydrolase [Eubacteriales bacterium]
MPTPIVIDSDTFNEIDDQFAIAYALCRPQQLTVRALLAAPFLNEKAVSPEDGMLKSLIEMKRIRTLCHSRTPVFAGSPAYLPEDGTPVKSPACDELIRLARAMPEGKRLYVAAIAALTNIASALLKAPEIKDRLVIYWLGAHAKDFTEQNEFNLRQDLRAAQVVFDSGVPVVWFPCRGVCSHLSLSLWEAEHWLCGKNTLADALLRLLRQSDTMGMGQTRILWDVAPIAALCNPQCVQTERISAPIVTEGPLRFPPERSTVEYVLMIARDQVFADFFAAIGDFAPEDQGITSRMAHLDSLAPDDTAN